MIRFIRQTLTVGLPVVLGLALVEVWRHGFGLEAVFFPLVGGLFAGLGLAGYTTWHLRRLERNGVDTSHVPLRPRRRLRVEGGPAEVLAAGRAALATLKGTPLVEEESGMRLVTRTPFTFRSFGEKVRLTLVSQGDGACDVEISSAPVLVTTLLDYGKNLENVETVNRALAARLPCRPVA